MFANPSGRSETIRRPTARICADKEIKMVIQIPMRQ